ncbi:MAG: CoA transferase [Alphaproteobacteria bacterium]|nr:CoA transferase [Alphaproteobacteria bacterium]
MKDILEGLLKIINQESLLDYPYEVSTGPTVTNTKFRGDEASVGVSLAIGLMTSRLWEIITGQKQSIHVDQTQAALTLISFILQTQNGYPICYPDTHRTWPNYPIMDAYKTKDDRFIYIDGVYPHLRDGLLDILKCHNEADALANAVRTWNSNDLEAEINGKELCGAIIRTPEEWLAHPQGKLLAAMPPVKVTKVSHSDPVIPTKGSHPLSGVRVIDITHVLAGPMSTRALAGQGAEVLHISGPNVFELFPFFIDTGHGKRNAFLDLNKQQDKETLKKLVEKADVFVQGYMPGKFEKFGFSPQDVFGMKEGIIYTTISCYGTDGPMGKWGGFEQLGQAASGLLAAHSEGLEKPQLVPAAICDYLTGYLGTLGMLSALYRRATEGGSYHVEVSLTRTAMWLLSLGLRSDAHLPGRFPENLDKYLVNSETCFGTIKHVKPIVEYSATPTHYKYPVSALGSSKPQWID